MKQFSKYEIATAIALLFHLIGLLGIFYIDQKFFVSTTPLHLLLMLGLLFYTQNKITLSFVAFLIISFITGVVVEIAGTSTGQIFGNYVYGTNLGPMFNNVPLIIGVNWFIVIYCCGITVHTVIRRLASINGDAPFSANRALRAASVIFDGATLAVFFDWIMEPAAVKLGFWQWKEQQVPALNYWSWFIVSALLLAVFELLKIGHPNKFAVHLLMIQLMFFLIIRLFL